MDKEGNNNMKTKIFLLPVLALISLLGMSACSEGGPNGGGSGEPSIKEEKLVFSDVRVSYDNETEVLKVFYTLQTDEAKAELEIYGKERGGYLHLHEYVSGTEISTKREEFPDDQYNIRMHAFVLDYRGGDTLYTPSDAYEAPSFTVKHIPIDTPVTMDYCRVSKFAYGKCVGNDFVEPDDEHYSDEEFKDATEGWYVFFNYHFSNAYANPYFYMFDENDELISYASGLQSGYGWLMPYNAEPGTYHFTVQGRGWVVQRNTYTSYSILNTDVYPVEGTYTIKKPLTISELEYGLDDIISWNVDEKELAGGYSVSICEDDKERTVVYTATENTPFHKVKVDLLEPNTRYIAKIKAKGDDSKLSHDSKIKPIAFTNQHGEYSYSGGNNTCSINVSPTEKGEINVGYTIQNSVSFISICVIDIATNNIIARRMTNYNFGNSSMNLNLREFGGRNVRFVVLAYDKDHQYRDAVATKDFELPTFSDLPFISSVTAERVDNRLYIDVKTTAECQYLRVLVSPHKDGVVVTDEVTTIENGKYVYEITDYPYRYFSADIYVDTYYQDDEDSVLDSVCYYYGDPAEEIPVLDLDYEMTQQIEGKDRIFNIKINDKKTLRYPAYEYVIAKGNQPIMDDFLGSPNFDETTESYKDTFSFKLRISDIKSGETYSFTLKASYLPDVPETQGGDGEGEEQQIHEVYLARTISFVAL